MKVLIVGSGGREHAIAMSAARKDLLCARECGNWADCRMRADWCDGI